MNGNEYLWKSLFLATLMAVVLCVGLSEHPASFDDAYITYRYARNIAQGRGFVYNPGEPVLGTTTPFYALLLAGLSVIWQNIPRLSHVIGTGAWMMCVPTIYGIARADRGELVGLVAASFTAVNALFLNVLGMETTLYVLVTLLAFYFYLHEKYTCVGFFAGIAFLTRWDGILVTGVLIFAGVLEHRKRFPKPLLVSACLIVPWLAYSQMTFGSIFPNTLFAKAGQGWKQGLGGTEIGPFARGLVLIARSAYAENPLVLLPVALSAVGALSAFRDRTKWWPLLLWTAAYFAGYTVLGVLRFPWYYPPLMPAILLLIAKGIEELVNHLPRARKGLHLGLALLLIGFCLIPSVDWLLSNRDSEMNKHLATYVEVGNWLRDHTSPGNSVATIEIGAIGFYSDRPIVDTMGLVSPDMVGHLDDWLQTLQFALNHYWPNYAVTLAGTAWDGVIHQAWFEEAYVLAKRMENRANPSAPVRIYRRRPEFPIDEFAITSVEEVRFDEKFALRSFQVAEAEADGAESLHVQLTWEALADVNANYLLRFDLLNASSGERTTLRQGAHPMRGGNPTELWTAGDRVVDAHTLRVPNDMNVGPYLLQLIVSREGANPRGIDSTGNPVDYIVAGPIHIGDGSRNVDSPARMVEADFSDHVSLIGYDLNESSEDHVDVTLYWEAMGKISQDYTVFVHLISPEGELLSQHDGPPPVPTKLWVPGIPVVDSRLLALPPDLSPARYEIRTGMYHWPDLQRLPIVESNNFDVAHDALLLSHVSTDQSSILQETRFTEGNAQDFRYMVAKGVYR